jgi:hypothetical protein
MHRTQFIAVAAGLTMAVSSVVAQQGRGASSAAGAAVAMLYNGPIGTTAPGRPDVVPTLPPDFPVELPPTGSVIGAIGVGTAITVVVSSMPTTLGRTGTIEAVLRVVRDKPAARAPGP